MGEVEQIRVPVVTLNEYSRDAGIEEVYLINIDVQGFEIVMLRGAERILAHSDYVFVEAGLERLYEGAPSFAEVFLHMEQRGFHRMTMRAWHRGRHRLVETDMLFRRNGLDLDIDRRCSRHYVSLRQQGIG